MTIWGSILLKHKTFSSDFLLGRESRTPHALQIDTAWKAEIEYTPSTQF